MMRSVSLRMAIHPLPTDAERRTREIERVRRDGYQLLELWQERGEWWGRFLAPARVA